MATTPQWRQNLHPGSFRGVGFLWRKLDTEIGRRVAQHHYPQRDDAFVEDLGLLPRKFSVEAYVIGPGYMRGRDKLIAALEAPGPGPLSHPTLGTVTVQLVAPAQLSESTEEGGMARFTLNFLRVQGEIQPTAKADTQAAVAARADAVQAAAAADAASRLTSAVPKSALALLLDKGLQLVARANAVRSQISSVMDTVLRVKGIVDAVVAIPAQLIRTVQGLVQGLIHVARHPVDTGLYTGLFGSSSSGSSASVDILAKESAGKIEALKTVAALADFGSDLPELPVDTPRQRAVATSRAALVTLVQVSAVAEVARIASEIDYPTYDDCVAVRDLVAQKVDALLEGSELSDTLYAALVDLRTAVVEDAAGRGANLSRLASYTPRVTLPALVVAHTLYGDATRADELVARNRLAHPGFVAGGHPLQILVGGE